MADSLMSQGILYKSQLLKFLEDEAYLNFLNEACTRKDVSLLVFTFPIEAIDPLACLEILSRKQEFQYYWENPNQDLSIAAGGEVVALRASGPDRFERIHQQQEEVKTRCAEYSVVAHSYAGLNIVGGFSFHDENTGAEWDSYDAAHFSVPEWMVVKEGKLALLTLSLPVPDAPSVQTLDEAVRIKLRTCSEIFSLKSERVLNSSDSVSAKTDVALYRSTKAYELWVESVKKARSLIAEKQFDKIVLAREFKIDTDRRLAPTHILNDLRQQYPNCYSFLIGWQGSKTFIGCSPERLAAFRNNFLLTEALAGSIQRGVTATEDAVLGKELLNSLKNASEHNYVIRAIEQKLQPFSDEFRQDKQPGIKKFSNVQHLFTPITVRLKNGLDRFAILNALHPTPAVGGYPWEKASPYLKKLEHFDRGWYAGLVGWLNSKGDGEFTVSIRSGLIQDKEARFYAGCGIVADSNPDDEWRETSLKLIPMLSALRYD
jgi:menaquinone-specific isochorismate synthase